MHLPIATGSSVPRSLSGAGRLFDAQGRRISYLRLSVTDRCNFRCGYCSPANWAGKGRLLAVGEILRLVSVFVSRGVDRVRLTGGEPLLRRDLPDIARGIASMSGVEEVCLTTNGDRLASMAAELKRAGVSVVNVSLDTLDKGRFREVTKRGDLTRVLRGLEAAAKVGFARLGVNAVVQAGVNDAPEALAALARRSWSLGAVPRFIERMPFAGEGEAVPSVEVRRRLERAGIACERGGVRAGAGPATYYRATDGGRPAGEIGFIGAMTESFCAGCNRVRISATGDLRACLGGRSEAPLAALLRGGAGDGELEGAIRAALLVKWEGHRFVEDGGRGLLPMMGIGG